MTLEEFQQAHQLCDHFLAGHYPRTVQARMQEIADSPYSEARPDMYGRGGFLAQFEREIADLLGKEAAVFMPSGTMAQQIALRIWSDKSEMPVVAYHPKCHLECHEHMAYRELHRLEAILVGEQDRLFNLEDLKWCSREFSTLLIELPQRDLGGELPTWEDLNMICDWSRSRNIRLHLDGARLWECGPYYGRSYHEVADLFDSAYVSFYKILGGLPGAALAGPAEVIEEAKIWQRRHGGNLVHLFPNAISAKIGMDRHLPRIGEYVGKASEIADVLSGLPGVTVIPSVPQTNMMHLVFEAPRDVMMERAARIAHQERVWLFSYFTEFGTGSRTEFVVGNGALDLPRQRIASLLTELLLPSK